MFQNWEDHEKYREEMSRVGPGEQGKPVTLPKGDPNIEKEAVC